MTPSLIESIKAHEGFRSRAYQDTVGVWTIGYGTNLQTLELSPSLAEQLLVDELKKLIAFFDQHYPYLAIQNTTRQDVILEMAYNLGISGVLKFRNMWAAIRRGDWDRAAAEMLDSKWAKQVGRRADTLAERMRTGG